MSKYGVDKYEFANLVYGVGQGRAEQSRAGADMVWYGSK